MSALSIIAVPGIPEIHPGDDLAAILAEALEPIGVEPNDILIVAQKVVSKAEGLLVDLATVTPGEEANALAQRISKDPRKVEVVLRESARVVKSWKHPDAGEGTLICEHVSGHISANAGVDQSNIGGEDMALLLPRDPDASAAALLAALTARFQTRLGVVISDTFGRPWRLGQVNVAIGMAGLPALKSEVGNKDAHGRDLAVTQPAFGDELAAASGLAISKASQTPLVVIRGLTWDGNTGQASDLVRKKKEDMFR
ncbi:coenzyme F420-0:L-glutamate ligase [Shimia sp.]|uniref:coenzyme F420-0:L-glutamate ligase n=1 Tax=Shimia sp. TaxID=1954381 RepID=UPI003BA85669